MSVETKRASQAAATRTQLVATGRRLFAERGYAGTATEEIVAEAGVTRGALYYHFRNKQDLFRAVFEDVEEAVHERVSAVAMAEPEPWDGLVAGCRAYLEASLDPTTQRIALIDAPSVLGWDAWHAGFQHLFGLLAIGLHWAVAAGEIEDQPVVPLAHVLLGALNEGAMFIARSDDRGAARDGVAAAISQVLAGLRRTA
jgi:AcrR family transcriptional regulator